MTRVLHWGSRYNPITGLWRGDAVAKLTADSSAFHPRLASGAGLQLAVGLLVGLLVWAVHPPNSRLVPIPDALRQAKARNLKLNTRLIKVHRRWDYHNCGATLGLIGLLACGSFGVVEGSSRGSWRGAGAGLMVGMLAGGVTGVGLGLLGRYIWAGVGQDYEDLQRGMMLQTMLWTMLGLVAGACMGLPTQRVDVMLRCALATATAGLASALLFGILAAYFFPLDSTDGLIPEGHSRILWTMLTTGLMGVVGGWYGAQRQAQVI